MMPVKKWNELQARLQANAAAQSQLRSHAVRPPVRLPVQPPVVGPTWPSGHFGTYWRNAPVPMPGSREAHVQKALQYLCKVMRSCDVKNLALHVLILKLRCSWTCADPYLCAFGLIRAHLLDLRRLRRCKN